MKKIRSDFNSRQYMLAEDFELYYYSDLNLQHVGNHSHAYYEVYLFSAGSVDMVIDNVKHSLHPGDMIIVPPQTLHRAVIRKGEVPYQRFVFWLSVAYCARLKRESPDYLYLFSHAEKEKEYIYHLNLLEFNSTRSKLFSLLEELHTDRFGRDTQIDLSVRDLILMLNRTIYQKKYPATKKEKLSSYQTITDYITNHLEEDLSRAPDSGKYGGFSASVYHKEKTCRLLRCHAGRAEYRCLLCKIRFSELFKFLQGIPQRIRHVPIRISAETGVKEILGCL